MKHVSIYNSVFENFNASRTHAGGALNANSQADSTSAGSSTVDVRQWFCAFTSKNKRMELWCSANLLGVSAKNSELFLAESAGNLVR
jgi:hypothetical protein